MKRFLALTAATVALAACHPGSKAIAEPGAAEAFLAKNAKEKGVVTLPDGLQYKVVRSGPAGGVHPTPDDLVKVNYEGKLLDGTVFDSSYERGQPAVMPVGMLVPAWVEALQLMKPGDEWTLYVPPALGYGDEAKGPIPAHSVMVFRLELIDVHKATMGG